MSARGGRGAGASASERDVVLGQLRGRGRGRTVRGRSGLRVRPLGASASAALVTLADIAELGVEIWMGPVTLDDGNRIVFINGPDNVKIELMEQS